MTKTAPIRGYREIAEHLGERIGAGQWPVNSIIPGRTELAREYDVARKTIDRAIQRLSERGLLSASSRRGTFVKALGPVAPPAANGAAHPSRMAPHSAAGVVSGSAMLLQGRTVGVVCALDADMANASYVAGREPWDLAVVREIEAECSRQGGRTCVASLPVGGRSERDAVGAALDDVLSRGAGIVICIQLYDRPTLLEQMRRAVATRSVGGVFVVSRALAAPVPHVFPDQFYAGYQAAQHLLDAGYERILFLATIASRWVDERIEGARAAISQAGRSGDALFVAPEREKERLAAEDLPPEPVVLEASQAQLRAAAKKCGLDRADGWGVIAANDIAGFGVLEHLAERGKRPGLDVGVIGFDDNMDSRLRGMSSLRMPLVEIGRAATDLAAGVLNGSQASPQARLLWQLAARASTSRTTPIEIHS